MLPVLHSHKEYISFVDKHMGSVQIPKAHMALNSKHTLKATAREYVIVTQFPVSAQDSSIHQMLPGVTTLTEIATSLAITSIRLTTGAGNIPMNYLSIS
jgi:hypothetical protein